MCGGFLTSATKMEEVSNRSSQLVLQNLFCSCVFFFNLGAFLVPYLVLAVICGIPLFLLETTVGQYTQEGSVTCFRKLCPIAEGRTYYIFTIAEVQIIVLKEHKEGECEMVIHYLFSHQYQLKQKHGLCEPFSSV